jgi:hypothetical protein
MIKIVLVTELDSIDAVEALPLKTYANKLWLLIKRIVAELNHTFDIVELSKLDFQEDESVNKYLYADIVIMVCSNDSCSIPLKSIATLA